MQTPPKLTIFEDPKVPCRNLDPTYKTLLMDLSLSLDKYRSLFVLLRSFLEDNGGVPVTEEDVKKSETKWLLNSRCQQA
jgi:hypothetical protein